MMEWINVFGTVFVVIIMIPNIIYALKCKNGFENKWHNKAVQIVEQIGRFGCFGRPPKILCKRQGVTV